MKNVEFLYNENKGKIKLEHLRGNNIDYKSNVKIFDFNELKRMIMFFYSVQIRYMPMVRIKHNVIYKKQIEFVDKLTYVLLECLLYDQIVNKNKDIALDMRIHKDLIKTEGIKYSSLLNTNDKDRFKSKFLNDISQFHYRKLINYQGFQDKPETVSLLLSDLEQFLTTCDIEVSQAKQLSEISVELIDNALEHSQADCLFDMDVTEQTYYKDGEDNEEYKAVNIVVIDFSNNTLELGIKNLAKDINDQIDLRPQKKLIEIEKIHETFFNATYSKDQFYMLSTFQNRISSRSGSRLTGGTGLTKLIDGLQKVSDSDICYVVSSDNCLYFRKDQIKQDHDQWVGFNVENDCKLPPDKEALKKSPVNILGTAYNLTFVLKCNNKEV